MVRTGSTGGAGVAAGVSSSDMPFLKALMPFATSPIMSEILPRPNRRTTIKPTTIQCQILVPPMAIPPAPEKARFLNMELVANLCVGGGENKDILSIDLDAHILSLAHTNGIVNAGLKRAVYTLHVDVDEIDLAEKATRHHTSRQAEAGRLELQTLRTHANDGRTILQVR